jgi:hypothetical protein
LGSKLKPMGEKLKKKEGITKRKLKLRGEKFKRKENLNLRKALQKMDLIILNLVLMSQFWC